MRKYKSRAIKHVAPSAYAKCLRNFTYAKWLRHASAQAKWPTQLLKSSLLYKFHDFKKTVGHLFWGTPIFGNIHMFPTRKRHQNKSYLGKGQPWETSTKPIIVNVGRLTLDLPQFVLFSTPNPHGFRAAKNQPADWGLVKRLFNNSKMLFWAWCAQ